MGTTLNGTQINNTYPGLLKSSDNAAIGATEKVVGDGVGNDSTLSLGTSSASFTGTLDLSGATVSGIDGLSPTGGTTGQVLTKDSATDYDYSWTDAEDTTYTLDTAQSGSDATITLTGSDASTDVITLAAGTNITLTEAGDTITIAAAGGGGGAEPGLASTTRGFAMGTLSTNEIWRTTYVPDTFATGTSTISNNQIKVVAIQLKEGQTIRDFGINVTTASSAGTVTAAIYKAAIDTNGQIKGGALEDNFGTIDTTSTGEKNITDIDHTLGSTEEDIYFLAIHNTSGSNVGVMAVNSSQLSGPVYHSSIYATTAYRGNTWHATASGSLPTTLNTISFSKSTDFPMYAIR